MYCRSAFFIGSLEPAAAESFKSQIEGPVAAAMRNFPGIRELRIKWAREVEDGAPEILLTLEHCYDSRADLELALGSQTRAEVWAALDVAMLHFTGKVLHINNEVRTETP